MNFTAKSKADLELISTLLNEERYDSFIAAESAYYHDHIRTCEDRHHYERHYVALNSVLEPYGDVLRRSLKNDGVLENSERETIVFFLPNIDNDFAHISMLVDLIEKLYFGDKYHLVIAGFAQSKKIIASSLIHRMYMSGKVEIYPLLERHYDVINFLAWFKAKSKALLVSYSQPRLLTPFIRALGSQNVLWHVTKFDVNPFPELRFGMRGMAHNPEERAGGTIWYTVPGQLPIDFQFSYRKRGGTRIKVVSVNREQKLLQGKFLEVIADVLKEERGTHFYWTGREWDAEIRNRFALAGASERHTYLGWLNHKNSLPCYDIFADTFGLSGTVAAAAFAAGMPTVMMRGAMSWLERTETEIIQGQHSDDYIFLEKISGCLASSASDYNLKLRKTISDVRSKSFNTDWQKYLASKYFLNFEAQADKLNRAFHEVFQKATGGP